MKTLAPCDHDECPPTRCNRTASDEAVVCKELLGDWPTQHEENGNYQGKCCHCGRSYVGPKRSVTCYVCHEEGVKAWNALTPEQQHERQIQLAKEFRKLMSPNDGGQRPPTEIL